MKYLIAVSLTLLFGFGAFEAASADDTLAPPQAGTESPAPDAAPGQGAPKEGRRKRMRKRLGKHLGKLRRKKNKQAAGSPNQAPPSETQPPQQ